MPDIQLLDGKKITFDKTIKQVSKKYRVPEKELMGYFEKEMLTI